MATGPGRENNETNKVLLTWARDAARVLASLALRCRDARGHRAKAGRHTGETTRATGRPPKALVLLKPLCRGLKEHVSEGGTPRQETAGLIILQVALKPLGRAMPATKPSANSIDFLRDGSRLGRPKAGRRGCRWRDGAMGLAAVCFSTRGARRPGRWRLQEGISRSGTRAALAIYAAIDADWVAVVALLTAVCNQCLQPTKIPNVCRSATGGV